MERSGLRCFKKQGWPQQYKSGKAGKAIDIDWKQEYQRMTDKWKRAPVEVALEMAVVVDADEDRGAKRNADSSSEDDIMDDDFAHLLIGESQNARTEDLIPRARWQIQRRPRTIKQQRKPRSGQLRLKPWFC